MVSPTEVTGCAKECLHKLHKCYKSKTHLTSVIIYYFYYVTIQTTHTCATYGAAYEEPLRVQSYRGGITLINTPE